MKNSKVIPRQLYPCFLWIFLYFASSGCTESQNLIDPTHLTLVPRVEDFQATVSRTSTGRLQVILAWTYDTTNTNIRSWDVQRSVDDTAEVNLSYLDIVRKPTQGGFPSFADSSSILQNFLTDSLDVFYRVLPNSEVGSYVGEPSPRQHVIIRR